MRVKNPKFEHSGAAASKGQIQALINGKGINIESLTFDEIRTELGKTAEQLPDGTIHQACLDLGFEVEL